MSYRSRPHEKCWICCKDLSNIMNKPIGFKNLKDLRYLIKNQIQNKVNGNSIKIKNVDFTQGDISIKPIDYYYTNPIARSSKVMSECRQIKKRYLFTGIEKAS